MRILFIHLLLVTVLVSCNSPVSPDAQNRFAMYLLQSDTLTTKDVEGLELVGLELNNRPFISYDDIVGYNMETHKVYLNEKLSNYFGSDSLTIFSEYFGKPFIIVANDQRIYLCSFHSSFSSWRSNTPQVVDFSANNDEKSFIISGAPYYDKSSFKDVRNDERIFLALRDKMIK